MMITQVGLPCAKCASKCGCHPSYFYGSILTMQLQRLTFFFRSGCLLMFGHLTREISGHRGHDTNCQSLAFQTVWCQFLSNQKDLFAWLICSCWICNSGIQVSDCKNGLTQKYATAIAVSGMEVHDLIGSGSESSTYRLAGSCSFRFVTLLESKLLKVSKSTKRAMPMFNPL
jgi:hypothetical protein